MPKIRSFWAKPLQAEEEGEVLVVEVDGKCPPTATEEELTKRRGQRQPKHLISFDNQNR